VGQSLQDFGRIDSLLQKLPSSMEEEIAFDYEWIRSDTEAKKAGTIKHLVKSWKSRNKNEPEQNKK
jgi:hypothetical protein